MDGDDERPLDIVICTSCIEYAHNISAWEQYNVTNMSDSLTWHLLIKLGACSVLVSLKLSHLPVIRLCFD